MYEVLIAHLRECAKLDPSENIFAEAANAIEELSNAGSIYGKAWTLGYDAGREESKSRWIPVTDKEYIPNTDHGVVGYFGGGAFNQLRWYDFVTTLSDGEIVGENTERDVINEHCIAVCKLPEPPKEES